ncbi:hypothetical protein AB0K20_21365, partial [Micromonospora matsumotoense]|uniref:hypothetical protein n=1 Tax=Micromonospora matsumotoense TaxID=121616 RepID=UPI00341A6B38
GRANAGRANAGRANAGRANAGRANAGRANAGRANAGPAKCRPLCMAVLRIWTRPRRDSASGAKVSAAGWHRAAGSKKPPLSPVGARAPRPAEQPVKRRFHVKPAPLARRNLATCRRVESLVPRETGRAQATSRNRAARAPRGTSVRARVEQVPARVLGGQRPW